MQEGLEKVCRIKLPSIDETIKRIEQFNERCLSKYRQRDQKSISDESADQSDNQGDNNHNFDLLIYRSVDCSWDYLLNLYSDLFNILGNDKRLE